MMEGPQCRFRREARARERHQYPVVDGLKVLDPKRPIREADMERTFRDFRVGPIVDISTRYPSNASREMERRERIGVASDVVFIISSQKGSTDA